MTSSEDKKKQWVVVTTEYPSCWGCNYGANLSEIDILQQTGIERSKESFDSKKKAIEQAKKKRDSCGWFDDLDFDPDDKPPFDSSAANNYDNDEEVHIQVMTVFAFEEHIQEKNKELEELMNPKKKRRGGKKKAQK